ncbi:MAG: NAD(P)H-dependent oxidoreductase [Chloracidobacterium sp.]|nr:NAD(P)H-dependent oxidoreductase [Chloracidobacterium sp.]MCO5333370.1 NAD(P)H-dependent oxidoreductase [Pyrinomonadaceae bacterium]
MKILGISGSLRKGAYNTAVLHAVGEIVPEGVDFEIFDLSGIEPFNDDMAADPPQKVKDLKAAVRSADAVIFSSPEYNYSIPGHLKNAIDWASRPYGDNVWEDKPALIVGASIGAIGTARMQYHLRQSMVFLNMHPLNKPEVMINNAADKFDENGELKDEKTREHLKRAVEALIVRAKRFQG